MNKQKLTVKQEKWLTLLESGKYKQGREYLYDGESYCCLGVAARFVCKIKPEKSISDGIYLFSGSCGSLPHSAIATLSLNSSIGFIALEYSKAFYKALKAAGYKGKIRLNLSGYNDAPTKATFKQIAKAVRKVPQAVFC